MGIPCVTTLLEMPFGAQRQNFDAMRDLVSVPSYGRVHVGARCGVGARIAPPFMEATDASRLVCVVVVSYQEYSLTHERGVLIKMNSGARDAAQTGHKRQATNTGRHVVTQGSLGDGGVLRRCSKPELVRNLIRRRELQRNS